MDDHKVKPSKDSDVCPDKRHENEQDISRGFLEDATPESAKANTYCLSNRTIDNESFNDSYFVNVSEKQFTVVKKLTRHGRSSEISPQSDASERMEIGLSRLRRKPPVARKHQCKKFIICGVVFHAASKIVL